MAFLAMRTMANNTFKVSLRIWKMILVRMLGKLHLTKKIFEKIATIRI